MLDHHRRIIKLLKRHAPGLRAELVRESRHVVMDFIYEGQTVRITMSKTPKTPAYEVQNSCADVCKALNLPKIVH